MQPTLLQKLPNALISNQLKSFIILAVLCRSVQRVCVAHLRFIAPAGNTASFEEMSRWWRAVGNTLSDLTGLRCEPQTSHSINEYVTARPTGRLPFNF